MYKLAGEEAAEKQRNAEARMAERYAELERERERKKVKVLDRAPVGVGGMRSVGGGGVYGREKGPGECHRKVLGLCMVRRLGTDSSGYREVVVTRPTRCA